VRVLNALQATDLIRNLAPQTQVSPLALLRNEGKTRYRVRHRRNQG